MRSTLNATQIEQTNVARDIVHRIEEIEQNKMEKNKYTKMAIKNIIDMNSKGD